MNILMESGLVFALMAVALGSLYIALYGGDRVLRERYAESAVRLRRESGAASDGRERGAGRSMMRWAVARLPDRQNELKITGTLVQAGFRRAGAVAIYRIVRIISSVIGGLAGLGFAFLRHQHGDVVLLCVVGGGLVGAHLPAYYVRKLARRRQRRIARQLSDVLDLLVVCVEAGMGLFESIKIVGDEAANQGQEIGQELSIVSGEVAAGGTLGQALRNFAARTAVEEMKPLAATLIQSEQLGAQISPALRASSDMLRTRRQLRAEEAAQRTTIKILFPLVLFILPAMLMLILAPALIQAMRTIHM